MILAIRISGLVEVSVIDNETLSRMRLRRKYSAVLLKDTPENKKLIASVRNFIAYGPVDAETLKLIIEKRGQLIDKKKKVNAADVVASIEKLGLEEQGLKPFFRLHPPRGGIETKIHFPKRKGVLGDNKEKINELVRKML
jgi:large subunit ribosomal protein L30